MLWLQKCGFRNCRLQFVCIFYFLPENPYIEVSCSIPHLYVLPSPYPDSRFPTAFGLHPIPQEEKTPPRKRKKLSSPRRFSMTNRDLRLLADESQRKCQYYLMKQHHRFSSKE
ncbi:hypothetical protein ANCCAN_00490 [Ancylostoma caninum]|uniref:Uncharacterized protein n=1 Tax=Ancylostoma caninum TaxID=29170 RepID=A0A368HDX6_ANCCA|nr:hypothetical protein ANCCAN_00490 [Ancylostoma caninum]